MAEHRTRKKSSTALLIFDVARLISKYDLLAVPVVDGDRVIGIVTVDDVIDALLEETTEDVQKFGGMAAITDQACDVKRVLANPEPSTHGTKLSIRDVRCRYR